MTKIKNTKKGMAKKTLSMSLVVAMLATSNVPVWAAEFSDGTDTAVETEAPAAETFSDDAAPVVEDTTDTTAAKATTNGTGFDITATDFTGVTNGGIVWGNKVSTTVTVTKKDDNTDNVDYYYVWKDNDGQITTEAPFSNGTVEYTPDAAQSGKDITLFVYAKKDNSVVWSWTSDSFKVQPKQLSDVINMKDDNTKLSLKSSFKKIYTGKAIVPTVDDIDFANLANIKDANNNVIFTASDFVIGSTEGDTVNVTTKGVNVYLTTTKAGYAGSVVINYTISPLDLTAENVSNYLEATFVTTSKPYTGNNIVLKNTDVKIVDKKSGVDLSSYIKGEDVIYISGANYIKAGTQFNTGKAGDADLTFPIATPDESKYKNYTISGDLTLKPTNSFSITKRDLSTVNVSIPEQAYQNGAIVTVAPSVATYTDKTTGEVLKLAGDVVITSTATTQGVHDVTVSPATNNTNVEGSTTAKLSVAASSLSTAKFSGGFDIILMDIQMRFMDGMTAAEKIRQMDQKVIIMFITNMIQYAVRGYEVDAMDYVVKPVEYFSFSQKLDKAVGRMRSEVKEFLTIPIGEGVVKIDIADIYFIEGQRHNVIYYTSRGDYCSRITMKELEEKLAVHNFFRCAKGYLVNMNHVEGFVGSDCVIHNVHIPVSRTRKKEFMNLLLQNLNME